MTLGKAFLFLAIIFTACSSQSRAEVYVAPPKAEPLGAFSGLEIPELENIKSPEYQFPWEQYQAETMNTQGIISSFSVEYRTLGSEASGRRYVSLIPGQSLEFSPRAKANALVVRFSLPDNPQGTGTTARLGVFVDGSLTKTLILNSAWSYAYGDFPWSSDPSQGLAHKFWDESQSLIPAIEPGQSLSLQFLDSEDSQLLHIDLVDLEWVSPPQPSPRGYLNVLDFGAQGDGIGDDSPAVNQAIEVAAQQGTGVYFPPGEYKIGAIRLKENIAISGAGMWHTRMVGSLSRFHFYSQNGSRGGGIFQDFAIFGDTDHRDDNSARDNAFSGTPSEGTVLERIWVEHKKCAFWVGNGGNDPVVKNLTIKECRFRNLMADAVNFCNGTRDSLVIHSHVRYSGDDALATWSAPGDPPAKGNHFIGNWIQLPWLANGIALYGGEDHVVVDNLIEDNVYTGSGLYVAAHFQAAPFKGTHRLEQNTLLRSGTLLSDQGGPAGAMRVLGWDKSIDQAWVLFEGNTVIEPVYSAITLHGRQSIQNIRFRNTVFQGEIPTVIEVKPRSKGGALVLGLPQPLLERIENRSPRAFTLILENQIP
jgi:hypothetical protein